jgi:heat shock protein HtpX
MSLGSYYFSDRIVLSISGARPADKKTDFKFYTVAENLSIATGLPKPSLYVIEDSAPNAFATGRDPEHAVVVATTGLLDKLTRTELEGVVAHELSHIRHFDTRLMSIVAVLVGTVALIGDWFLRMTWYGRSRKSERNQGQIAALLFIVGMIFAILSPIIAKLIQLAISRRREFLADSGAISITKQPQGLISALQKISKDKEPLEAANKATAHLFIENPFKNKQKGAVGWFSNLFNTHPPIKERITQLENMA